MTRRRIRGLTRGILAPVTGLLSLVARALEPAVSEASLEPPSRAHRSPRVPRRPLRVSPVRAS
eukprot:1655673-Pyramimonas_sp.AAC.1